MLTFDDGYFNNTLALPVLAEFDVPAVFFISTDHVLKNKCFWWDVLYRELSARGLSTLADLPRRRRLEIATNRSNRGRIIRAIRPDRLRTAWRCRSPVHARRAAAFARDPHVYIGNHTADHAILTNYSPEEVCAAVDRCQETLQTLTGKTPKLIAYPNGSHSRAILQACEQVGLKGGFTIRPEKSALPLLPHSPQLFRLGRFAAAW